MALPSARAVYPAIKRRLTRQLEERRLYRHYRNVDYREVKPDLMESLYPDGGLLPYIGSRLQDTLLSDYLNAVEGEITRDNALFEQHKKLSDGFVDGEFTIYDRKLSLGEELDWNVDITGSGSWPTIFFKKYRTLIQRRKGKFGDFRYTWELNRQQHLLGLSIAYKITADKRYADCVINHILTWSKKNPPFQSINWISSMEVGLRLSSWCLALALLRETSIDRREENLILTSIYQQCRYLQENLSVDLQDKGADTKLKNNHTIVELASLMVVLGFFPELALNNGMDLQKEHLMECLVGELRRQTYPDGMHVEQASSYLRFVTESLLLTRMLVSDTEALDEYIVVYVRALTAFSCSKEEIFLIGDEDNGHVLLPFYESRPESLKVVFGMYDVLTLESNAAVEASSLPQLFDSRAGTCSLLAESGHWLVKMPVNEIECSIYFRSGKMDFPGIPGYAPHAHGDILSINLAVANELWLVDRGTYSYIDRTTADKLRLSAAHNTVMVDGFEQMRILGKFHSDRHAQGLMFDAGSQGASGRLTISREGRTIVVTRTIAINRDKAEIEVHDVVNGLAGEDVHWVLNLHPDVHLADNGILKRNEASQLVKLSGWETAATHRVPYSPRYGVLEDTSQLILSMASNKSETLEKKWSLRIIA